MLNIPKQMNIFVLKLKVIVNLIMSYHLIAAGMDNLNICKKT